MRQELKALINDGKRVTANDAVREQHSKALSYYAPSLPDVVVYPKTRKEVCQIVNYANTHQIPLVPFGAGSSLEGQIIPVDGGISLDFSMMNRILSIEPNNFLAVVEPGVTRNQLNRELKKHGLFFPIDPGADATIGGMTATNASGTNAVRYGVMRDYVLGLEVVQANGHVMRTGGKALKSSAGYGLTNLFVGSEGTLGVFTEITVKLVGIPETDMAAKAIFTSIEAAGQTALKLLKSDLSIGKIELVDEETIAAINDYKNTDYPVAPTLFLEFSGSRAVVEESVVIAKELVEGSDCLSFQFETDSVEKAKLWEARHHAAFAIIARYKNKGIMSADVCVPVAYLPEALVETRRIVEQHQLDAAIFGHVGDGNYHAALPVDASDPEDIQRVEAVNKQIIEYALSKGGTCTGEHGIGLGKKQYLVQEHASAIPMMKEIKKLFDPNHILNPGKIF